MKRPAIQFIALLIFASTVISINDQVTCKSNGQCSDEFNSKYVCENNLCIRDHFKVGDTLEVFGLIVISCIALISNSGGVGAGTVITTVFTIFLSFTPKDAVHISRIYTFTGSLVNLIINWKKRDPKNKDKFMINYNIAAVMIPLHLAGAELGVMLGRWMPSISITLFLLACLIMSTVLTFKRAKQEQKREDSIRQEELDTLRNTSSHLGSNEYYNKDYIEKKDIEILEIENNIPHLENDKLSVVKSKSIDRAQPSDDHFYREKFQSVKTKDLLKEQYVNFIIMGAAFFTVLMSVLIRGGDTSPSILGFSPCSNLTWRYFWLSQFITTSLAFSSYNRNKIYLVKQSIENLTVAQDRYMRNKLFFASYITGLASGGIGVGGGMLLAVYMLSLGMDVAQCGLLSTFAILFSSSSTTIQSAIMGSIHIRHAYAIIFMSLIGSIVGNCWLRDFIRNNNKQSLILWLLVVILTVAVFVVPLQMIFRSFANPREAFSFGLFC